MKTRLAILLAGLIFLATPMLAIAHGGDRHDGSRHNKGWVKERHAAEHYRHGKSHKKSWQKRQIRKEVRKELRHHRKARPHYVRHHRPHHVRVNQGALLLGLPHLVFHIDW